MVARMPSWLPLALVAALAWAGCDERDDRDRARDSVPRQVQGELELPRAQAGAPDAGTRGGHGADRYVLRAPTAEALIRGRVEPASARVKLVDSAGRRQARVLPRPDGSFSALLPDLPRNGAATFRLSASADGAAPWRTEIVASRRPGAPAARMVRVPARDDTPPLAALLLHYGDRVVSSVAPVLPDRDAPLQLELPELDLTALTRDADGGTGRIRVSMTYVRSCDGAVERRTRHFPPSEIARVRVAPGAVVPAERRRRARVQFEPGCRIRGKAWADATNASGLESFSDQIHFDYGG